MANGSPSSRRQISTIARAWDAPSSRLGTTARARSTNSRPASKASSSSGSSRSSGGIGSAGTGRRSSPGTRSASRLVASTRTPGQAPRIVSTRLAAASTRCSQLSRISSRWRLASARSGRRAAPPPSPPAAGASSLASSTRGLTASSTAPGSSAGSRSDANSTSQAPSRPTSPPASSRVTASSARRVLPVPPGPTSVTSRPRPSSFRTWAISSSRPTKLVSGAGRFDGATAAGAGGPRRGGRQFRSDRQRRVLGEELGFQAAQLGAGVQAGALRQDRAGALVGAERVGLPAGRVQGSHELGVQPLAQGLPLDQRLELPDHPGLPAEPEVDLDAILQRRQAQLLKAGGGG